MAGGVPSQKITATERKGCDGNLTGMIHDEAPVSIGKAAL
jgi:hypothetical protein